MHTYLITAALTVGVVLGYKYQKSKKADENTNNTPGVTNEKESVVPLLDNNQPILAPPVLAPSPPLFVQPMNGAPITNANIPFIDTNYHAMNQTNGSINIGTVGQPKTAPNPERPQPQPQLIGLASVTRAPFVNGDGDTIVPRRGISAIREVHNYSGTAKATPASATTPFSNVNVKHETYFYPKPAPVQNLITSNPKFL